jgi:hypothetical protein
MFFRKRSDPTFIYKPTERKSTYRRSMDAYNPKNVKVEEQVILIEEAENHINNLI